MDFKDFVLHKDDGDSYVIGHPNGKSLTINKKGLSEKAHEVISKLKKYDDGGEVTANLKAAGFNDVDPALMGLVNPAPSPLQNMLEKQNVAPDYDLYSKARANEASLQKAKAEAPAQITADEISQIPQQPDLASNTPTNAEIMPGTASEIGPSSAGASLPQVGAAQIGQPASGMRDLSGYGQQQQGELAKAKAIGEEGKNESQAIADTQQQVATLPSATDLVARNKDKDFALQEAFMDKKIDPDKFWHDQSTGSKIASSIGLILSGFGSGVTGQKNMAQEFLNQAVERDIASQQNEQGKAKTLWQMNREALGTDIAANLQTRQQLYTGLQYQLQKAAADAKSPIAAANAKIAIGTIQTEKDKLNWQQSMLSPTVETAGGAAPGTEQANANHISMLQRAAQMGLVKPEIVKDNQDRTLPGIGIATRTPQPEDIKELEHLKAIRASVNEALNFQEQEAGSLGTLPGSAANAKAQNLRASIINNMNQINAMNRPGSGEVYTNSEKQVPDPGSFRSAASIAKLKNVQEQMDNRYNSIVRTLGVVPFQKTPEDKLAVAWAKNPSAPNWNKQKAEQILQQNGAK